MNKGQTKFFSFVEVVVNTAVGFGVAMAMNYYLVFWWTGVPISTATSFWMTVIFTSVSMIRSYIMRRIFNWLQTQGVS